MARVRAGEAPAWPLSSGRSVRRGSRIKRDFACTLTRHFPPALVGLRSQSRLMLEGRARYTQLAFPGSEPNQDSCAFGPPCRPEAQGNLLIIRSFRRAASGPQPPPATWRCQSPNPTAPAVVRRTAGKRAVIRLGLVKEDPKLRPWFRRRTLISLFSILSKGFYPLAHFFQRVVPDLQHPL
jgi:hypothetical protein